MNKLNFNRIIAKILIISIIFPSLLIGNNQISFATSQPSGSQTSQIPADMTSEINSWLTSFQQTSVGSQVIEYKYKEDGEEQLSYAIHMPDLNSSYPNIGYDANLSQYIYYVRDGSNNIVGQIPFSVNVVMAPSSADPLPSPITKDNYQSYIAPGSTSTVLEDKDGNLLKLFELDVREARQMAFTVELTDGSFITTNAKTFSFKEESLGQSILDWITNALSGLWDWAMSGLAKIFNDLLLLIADGINALINAIFGGEDLTLYKIIFGKIDKLSINYWGASTTNTSGSSGDSGESGNPANGGNPSGLVDNAPAPTLKHIVEYWYGVFRGIAFAVYLVMLLYIGIRILLSSTASSGQKYKEKLTAWLTGVIILVFYPYVMRYTVIINDAFVQMIDQGDPDVGTSSTDAMEEVRKLAEEKASIALTIVYIIMLGQLIVLLGVYYKRVFMMAFLITIFPIVAALFVWEKQKGGAKALSTWSREYVILVLTQTFHAVVYVVLIEGALEAFKTSNNWFVFMISVMFLFEAEKIIRSIFGMKSSAGTIGDLAATGAAAWAATSGVKKLFKHGDKKKGGEDAENARNAGTQIATAQQNTAVNRSLAATSPVTSSSSGGGSGHGGSGGGSGHGGSGGSGGGGASASVPPADSMANLQAAQAVATQKAFRDRSKKNILTRALGAATGGAAKATGITLGLTSGLASGSMKDGIANAAVGATIGGMVGGAVNGITGWTMNKFAGRVLKAKIRSGAMDDKFRDVGFDFSAPFDSDPYISDAKARIIREALAAQAAATKRGGKEKGELAFIKAIEKGRKREHL